ncbi:peptidylprolyl isomerase [Alkaliflexus imshenetskii]|uniref:peptidylprolyl isomerase n=1 Tax=Alkaliflexus imshenetskii TaxID=286730 RepID=UPI0004BA0B74|nr:peptidylprolyl isomerase [Alkaliflexus imshenetskii]
MIKYLYLLFSFLVLWACKPSGQSQPAQQEIQKLRGSYTDNVAAMVDIHTFDHYTRALQRGFGFYIGSETVITNLSLIQGAYRVRMASPGTQQFFDVDGYTAYDLANDLVALKVRRKNSNYLQPVEPITGVDTLYTLLRPAGDLLVRCVAVDGYVNHDSIGYYQLAASMEIGKPAFYEDHGLAGIVLIQNINGNDGQYMVMDAKLLNRFLALQDSPRPVIELSNKSDRVYPSHTAISGFRIVTNMGNINIRLYNETPEYRDNFIRLVTDNYFDSLTVHRVLRGFLIQTGAADTRDAGPNDVVGWQGPGYTLPMRIVPGIFHKRGAIASSKLPGARNPKDESDGSQFYIVSGRIYRPEELDDLEIQKRITFTARQREVYTTLGGAPHLDNDYTVFGEVTSGMELVDRISMLETYQGDRPVKDVRILRVETIWR